jgi:hypothetical protein
VASSAAVLSAHVGSGRHLLPHASDRVKSDDAVLIGPPQAWGPLARAMRFNHETVKSVAQKHSKDVAQIMLRWGLQHVSPPSSHSDPFLVAAPLDLNPVECPR